MRRARLQCNESQLRDQPQDVGEQVSRNCDLRHLEDDSAGVAHDFRVERGNVLNRRESEPREHACRGGNVGRSGLV